MYMSGTRSFLFLQGPYGPFFYRLGKKLEEHGCRVRKVVTNGGEWIFWPRLRNVCFWRGHNYEWPFWISQCMTENHTTDIVLMGDWRPLHREAILLARQRGIRVWVYEEGYLRPRFITLEEGGVNGASPLPKTGEEIRQRARTYEADYPQQATPKAIVSGRSSSILPGFCSAGRFSRAIRPIVRMAPSGS